MLSDMKQEMIERIEKLRLEVNRAQEEADIANRRVEDLERQHVALQSALEVLSGTGKVIQPYAGPSPAQAQVLPFKPVAPPLPGKEAMLNGEKIILEPGWRVGKNSYGEDVLLPEGTPDPLPMAEPMVPLRSAINLPPITDADKFDRPEDML